MNRYYLVAIVAPGLKFYYFGDVYDYDEFHMKSPKWRFISGVILFDCYEIMPKRNFSFLFYKKNIILRSLPAFTDGRIGGRIGGYIAIHVTIDLRAHICVKCTITRFHFLL